MLFCPQSASSTFHLDKNDRVEITAYHSACTNNYAVWTI